eukprot:scaffold305_cov110-Cylindrotheca_fusiformis.AAC.2
MAFNSKISDSNSAPVSAEYATPLISTSDNNAQAPTPNNYSYSVGQDPALAGRHKPVNIPCCPHCNSKNVRTRTISYPNAATWTAVAVGAVVFFPICWIPLVVDKMKKTDHYCQNCGEKLGTVRPLEGVGVKERF